MGAEEVKASPPRLSEEEEEDICNNVVVRIDGRLTKLSTTITTTRQRIVEKRKERDMQKRDKNRIPKVERDLEENMEWMEDDDKKNTANNTLLSSGRRSRLRERQRQPRFQIRISAPRTAWLSQSSSTSSHKNKRHTNPNCITNFDFIPKR